MDFIKVFFEKKKPLGAALHRKAMDYFRQYMIVGGMPQAVERYVETKDFERVDRVKRDDSGIVQGRYRKACSRI
ncbi:MAG: hypothetical protein ACLU00_02875 [Mediterraneibacter faecis]